MSANSCFFVSVYSTRTWTHVLFYITLRSLEWYFHIHAIRFPLFYAPKLVIAYQTNSDIRRETTGCSACPFVDRQLYKGDGNAALIRTQLSERLQTVKSLDIETLNFSRALYLVPRNPESPIERICNGS